MSRFSQITESAFLLFLLIAGAFVIFLFIIFWVMPIVLVLCTGIWSMLTSNPPVT
jgi:hypothetical protein